MTGCAKRKAKPAQVSKIYVSVINLILSFSELRAKLR